MKATVTVSLKAAVLDPQGKAIAAALRDLGLDLVESARVGKVIELQLSEGPMSSRSAGRSKQPQINCLPIR